MRSGWRFWSTAWLVISVVVGNLFAERHFFLAAVALAGVVWGCIRWTRPAEVRR
jgi:hypothetical protein